MAALRVLGAIIAGGQARRFGSDKACVDIDGRPMIAHVIAALKPQVEQVVICGRIWPGLDAVYDLRQGRIGPLAGLESALRYAAVRTFDGVLSVPVDTLPLPHDLLGLLIGARPRALRRQHLIGYWPVGLCNLLSEHVDDGERSLSSWLARSEAEFVDEPFEMFNVNKPNDAELLIRRRF
jgi:molybdopterin-guanine dinucleotide biosynthesis protein A